MLPLIDNSPAIASLLAPAALLGGTAVGLTLGNPFPARSRVIAKWLLQASVVLLGFSIDVREVVHAGRSGLAFSLISISFVFGLGLLARRSLKVRPMSALLISAGTAICGGSAIAAVSSVVEAPEEDVSVAVGTVFVLNALALLLFPVVGRLLGLSQHQFGVWAGIAIHDIASVVGAGTAYGKEALEVATAVKLSRVVYLVPVTLLLAFAFRRQKGERRPIQIPWFVGMFLLASAARSLLPVVVCQGPEIKRVATAGFALSLFLIGTALTRSTLKSVGPRPLILGSLLWAFISLASLAVVSFGG